jgi:hypothetical protein
MRLAIIEATYGMGVAVAASEAALAADRESRFDEEFRRVRAEVLSPTLEEIGAALTAAGHGHRVEIDAGEHRPSIELHIILGEAPGGSRGGVIRLFTSTGKPRGCEVVAEVELKRTLVELTRFKAASAMTPEVVEQMVADAVEQIFACHASG